MKEASIPVAVCLWGRRGDFAGPALCAPLQQVLAKVPPDVDTLIFPNYESLPEREDVTDPFTEVTLFKRNYAHVVSGGQKDSFLIVPL